jgi:ABC-type antimicrobial peptide transport system permease subunit
VRRSLRLAIVGALIGVGVAIPLAVLMQSFIVGATPVDALAIVPPVALILLVSLVAAILPARRAASIDPVRALRAE